MIKIIETFFKNVGILFIYIHPEILFIYKNRNKILQKFKNVITLKFCKNFSQLKSHNGLINRFNRNLID